MSKNRWRNSKSTFATNCFKSSDRNKERVRGKSKGNKGKLMLGRSLMSYTVTNRMHSESFCDLGNFFVGNYFVGNGRNGDDGFDDDWVGDVDVVGSDVVDVVVVVGEVFFVVVVVDVDWLVAGRFFIPPSSSLRSTRPGGGPRSGRVKVRLEVRRLEWQSREDLQQLRLSQRTNSLKQILFTV